MEFVFTGNFVCMSIKGEVMRTAENTTNTPPNFLFHIWTNSQSITDSTDYILQPLFVILVYQHNLVFPEMIEAEKKSASVTCPEIPSCLERMASEATSTQTNTKTFNSNNWMALMKPLKVLLHLEFRVFGLSDSGNFALRVKWESQICCVLERALGACQLGSLTVLLMNLEI